jgi:hypothetical protein
MFCLWQMQNNLTILHISERLDVSFNCETVKTQLSGKASQFVKTRIFA